MSQRDIPLSSSSKMQKSLRSLAEKNSRACIYMLFAFFLFLAWIVCFEIQGSRAAMLYINK